MIYIAGCIRKNIFIVNWHSFGFWHSDWWWKSNYFISIVIFSIWDLLSKIVFKVPPLSGIWGQLGLDENTFSCTILEKDGHSPKKFLFLVAFALPCLVITTSYSCIYWKVRRSKRRLEAHRYNISTIFITYEFYTKHFSSCIILTNIQ